MKSHLRHRTLLLGLVDLRRSTSDWASSKGELLTRRHVEDSSHDSLSLRFRYLKRYPFDIDTEIHHGVPYLFSLRCSGAALPPAAVCGGPAAPHACWAGGLPVGCQARGGRAGSWPFAVCAAANIVY